MTTKLELYNGALRVLGHDKIASLSTDAEKRYVLDDAYDGTLEACLEDGQWNFALRAVEIAYEPAIDPSFGYQYAFEIPSDLIRLTAISQNDTLRPSLAEYREEAGYWYADCDTLYVAYISNDASYGLDLSRWPPHFCKFVEMALASDVCIRLTQSDTKKQACDKELKELRKKARSFDAMAQPNKQMDSEGSWLTSRFARNYSGQRYLRG